MPYPSKAAREAPVHSWTEFDNVTRVRAAIVGMERGTFDRAAEVVEMMGRDTRLEGCLLTRAGALPALPMKLLPADDSTEAKRVVEELEKKWESMFPDYALVEVARWGTMLGFSPAELVWKDLEEELWSFTLRPWHPRHVYYRHDLEAYWLTLAEGQVQLDGGNGQWALYLPHGLRYGWMRGLARSLYVPWLLRQWTYRDWARYNEIHGIPARKAYVPATAEEGQKRQFVRDVAGLGSEPTIALPRYGSVTGQVEQFDVELLEAVGTSQEAFEKAIQNSSTDIAIALLGQNLTTEVSGGSYAAANVHKLIRGDVLQADAEKLGQFIQEQCLRPWCERNFGRPELAPRPVWQTKPPDDQKVRGESMQALGEGVVKLKAVGIEVDTERLMRDAEVPVKSEEDAAEDFRAKAEQVVDPNAALNGAQVSSLIEVVSSVANGLLPRETGVAIIAAAFPLSPQQADALMGDVGKGFTPKPPPEIQFAPPTAAKEKPVAQASQADDRYAALAGVSKAAVEGQVYVDNLVEDARDEMAELMAPHVRDILRLVEKAADYGALREALLAKYGEMDAEKEAELIHKVLVLAELNGRHVVQKEQGE